jgi:hypothetical protein
MNPSRADERPAVRKAGGAFPFRVYVPVPGDEPVWNFAGPG